jgi:hypothetical protein
VSLDVALGSTAVEESAHCDAFLRLIAEARQDVLRERILACFRDLNSLS